MFINRKCTNTFFFEKKNKQIFNKDIFKNLIFFSIPGIILDFS